MIRWAIGIVVAVGLLLVAAPAAQATTDSAAKAPKQWDPRVREFVRFVEKDRDLKFDHPVAVAFLDDAAFVQALDAGDGPTRQDRADAAHDAARLRAAGMIGPGVDLLGAQGGIDDTTTTGFYDPDTKKLYVRGSDLTDTDIHARPGDFYRRALAPHFRQVGAGLWSARSAGLCFYELEASADVTTS